MANETLTICHPKKSKGKVGIALGVSGAILALILAGILAGE